MIERLEPPQVNSFRKLERHAFWRDVFRRYDTSGVLVFLCVAMKLHPYCTPEYSL